MWSCWSIKRLHKQSYAKGNSGRRTSISSHLASINLYHLFYLFTGSTRVIYPVITAVILLIRSTDSDYIYIHIHYRYRSERRKKKNNYDNAWSLSVLTNLIFWSFTCILNVFYPQPQSPYFTWVFPRALHYTVIMVSYKVSCKLSDRLRVTQELVDRTDSSSQLCTWKISPGRRLNYDIYVCIYVLYDSSSAG